jgi:Predicted acyltransferases
LHITLDNSRLTALLQNRVLVWFGRRSYGLYVWHFPIYFLFRKLETPALAPVAVAVAILVAALSYSFIELPFLRMKAEYASQN